MNSQLVLTLISSIFISGTAAYLGTLMLSKKMTIVADPLSHLTLPGAALAILYGFELFIGVFPFVITGAVLIWFLGRKTKLPMENLTAIIFAAGVGTALLILPIEKAEEALVGNIGKITAMETLVAVLISIAVIVLVSFMYNKIMLMNVSEDIAKIQGINTGLLDFLYLMSIALVVGLGVYLVGSIITAALVAIPAGASKIISKSLSAYRWVAISFGVVSAIGGVLIAPLFHVPIGPAVIVINGILFAITLIISGLVAAGSAQLKTF